MSKQKYETCSKHPWSMKASQIVQSSGGKYECFQCQLEGDFYPLLNSHKYLKLVDKLVPKAEIATIDDLAAVEKPASKPDDHELGVFKNKRKAVKIKKEIENIED